MATRGSGERTAPKFYWAAVAVFAALVFGAFTMRLPILTSLQHLAFDIYQRAAPAKPLEGSPIKVVAIDEASLAAVGQWPWPRDSMAELTRQLGEAGAAAIVFDVLFAEADRTSPDEIARSVPPARRASVLRALGGGFQSHDLEFAETLGAFPTVLAVSLHTETNDSVAPVRAGFAVAGDDPSPFLADYPGVAVNLDSLSEAAAGSGFINWMPDGDQIVRRVPLILRQDGQFTPSLALEALRVATGASTYVLRASNASGVEAFGAQTGLESIRVGPITVPTDAQGQMWLRFRSYDPEEAISAARVLSGDVDRSAFEGAIVLIGASAPGLMDLRATPLDSNIPGVEIHRQLLEQIVASDFLTRPDYAPGIELLAALAAILILAIAAPRLRPSLNAGLSVALVLVFFGGGFWLFNQHNYLFDPVFPTLSALAFGAAATAYFHQRSETQRAGVRRAFSQYVSPSVVRQLVAHPERLKLGGEVRELTILVCDIRDFSAIAESLNAEQVTDFINSFLTPVSDIIIESGGTIDKYMGDAVMAFWNAPLDQADHAERAWNAALQIMARMPALNETWRAEAETAGRAFKDVRIGIGLNTGECCVGNLGSERRFDYSAIGDAVNIASRLESLSKIYGLALLASEETARGAKQHQLIEVGRVRLIGRAGATRMFTALPNARAPASHADFLAAFDAGRLDEARRLLAELQNTDTSPLAGVYRHYAQRLESAGAGGTHWDGVFDPDRK